MRRLALIVFFLASGVGAQTTEQTPAMDLGGWAYDCTEDGRLRGVHLKIRIPVELEATVPIPDDVCSPAHKDRMAKGINPTVIIRKLVPLKPATPTGKDGKL